MSPLPLLLALWTASAAAQTGPTPDCAAWMNKNRNAPESAAPEFHGYRQPQSFPADVRQVFDALTVISGLTETKLEYLAKDGLRADAGVFEQAACRAGASVDDAVKTFYVCDALAGIVEDKADLVFVMAHELAHLQRGDATSGRKIGQAALDEWYRDRYPRLSGRGAAERQDDVDSYVCGRVLEASRGYEREADRMATEFVIDHREELERRLALPDLKPDTGAGVMFKRKEFYFRQGIGEDRQHDTAEQRAHLIEKTVDDRLHRVLDQASEGF